MENCFFLLVKKKHTEDQCEESDCLNDTDDDKVLGCSLSCFSKGICCRSCNLTLEEGGKSDDDTCKSADSNAEDSVGK